MLKTRLLNLKLKPSYLLFFPHSLGLGYLTKVNLKIFSRLFFSHFDLIISNYFLATHGCKEATAFVFCRWEYQRVVRATWLEFGRL